MTLDEYINKLENALQQIEREGERQVAIAGADIAALVTNRVIQKGENADGGKFTPYSNTPVPAYWYIGKGRRNASDSAVKAKAKKGEKISYKEFRQLNGLNVAFKNFEFTGAMWRNFRVLRVEQSGFKFSAIIGGAIPMEQNKIDWLSKQEGRIIIEPNEKELQIVTANLTRWLNSLLN